MPTLASLASHINHGYSDESDNESPESEPPSKPPFNPSNQPVPSSNPSNPIPPHLSKYGIGAKLMMKMGYREGTGLGARSTGIVNPIETRMRPQGIGVGGVSDEKGHDKIEEIDDVDAVDTASLFEVIRELEDRNVEVPYKYKELCDSRTEERSVFDKLTRVRELVDEIESKERYVVYQMKEIEERMKREESELEVLERMREIIERERTEKGKIEKEKGEIEKNDSIEEKDLIEKNDLMEEKSEKREKRDSIEENGLEAENENDYPNKDIPKAPEIDSPKTHMDLNDIQNQFAFHSFLSLSGERARSVLASALLEPMAQAIDGLDSVTLASCKQLYQSIPAEETSLTYFDSILFSNVARDFCPQTSLEVLEALISGDIPLEGDVFRHKVATDLVAPCFNTDWFPGENHVDPTLLVDYVLVLCPEDPRVLRGCFERVYEGFMRYCDYDDPRSMWREKISERDIKRTIKRTDIKKTIKRTDINIGEKEKDETDMNRDLNKGDSEKDKDMKRDINIGEKEKDENMKEIGREMEKDENIKSKMGTEMGTMKPHTSHASSKHIFSLSSIWIPAFKHFSGESWCVALVNKLVVSCMRYLEQMSCDTVATLAPALAVLDSGLLTPLETNMILQFFVWNPCVEHAQTLANAAPYVSALAEFWKDRTETHSDMIHWYFDYLRAYMAGKTYPLPSLYSTTRPSPEQVVRYISSGQKQASVEGIPLHQLITTFRDVVAEKCTQEGILFRALSEAHPTKGHPLSVMERGGKKVYVYLHRDVLWVSRDRRVYEPVSVKDIGGFWRNKKEE